jgi:hypothetical protein
MEWRDEGAQIRSIRDDINCCNEDISDETTEWSLMIDKRRK